MYFLAMAMENKGMSRRSLIVGPGRDQSFLRITNFHVRLRCNLSDTMM